MRLRRKRTDPVVDHDLVLMVDSEEACRIPLAALVGMAPRRGGPPVAVYMGQAFSLWLDMPPACEWAGHEWDTAADPFDVVCKRCGRKERWRQ